MGFDKEMIMNAADQIKEQCLDHFNDMDVAFANDEDQKLAVSAKINIKYDEKKRRVVADTTVSFVLERIKDKRPVMPTGNGPLFDKLEPGESVSLEAGGRKVTLENAEGGDGESD